MKKSSRKHRTDYIYYTSDGTKFVITPGKNGVTEADIELLHEMDDNGVDEQRRYDYRVTEYLDAFHDGEGDDASDRNKHLADYRTNPESVLIAQEDDEANAKMRPKLTEAMGCLQPNQQELFKKVYIQRRSCTSIAKEEGVSEAAIRNRLKKMLEKLRKIFL